MQKIEMTGEDVPSGTWDVFRSFQDTPIARLRGTPEEVLRAVALVVEGQVNGPLRLVPVESEQPVPEYNAACVLRAEEFRRLRLVFLRPGERGGWRARGT